MNNGHAGMGIQRSIAIAPSDTTTYTVTDDANVNTPFMTGGASFGSMFVVSESGVTTVTAFASQNGTPADAIELFDANGVASTMAVSAIGWYEMPSAWLSVPALHLATDAGSLTVRFITKG